MKIHKTQAYTKILNKQIICDNKELIGSILYSTSNGKFKVIDKDITVKNNDYYYIKFINTGFETSASKSNIIRGTIKDYEYKSLYNIAYYGKDYINIRSSYPELCKILVSRWHGIIKRIYDKSDINYCRYGAVGVSICESWLCFSNFFYDIQELLEKQNLTTDFLKGDLHIDKDYLQQSVPLNKKNIF